MSTNTPDSTAIMLFASRPCTTVQWYVTGACPALLDDTYLAKIREEKRETHMHTLSKEVCVSLEQMHTENSAGQFLLRSGWTVSMLHMAIMPVGAVTPRYTLTRV
ncbi:Hypothetical protein POVN_LOCUS692 [uncultured virus]|nr:Hypothetical protein POVN_LOCUS692 [uncultured virus]